MSAEPLVTQDRDTYSKVPHWLLKAAKPQSVVVYAQLAAYAWMRDGARPPIKMVADDLGISESTVERAVRDLATVGALTVEHRFEGKMQLPSRYHLRLTPPCKSAPPGVRFDATPGVTDDATLASNLTDEEEGVKKKEVKKKTTAPAAARPSRGTRLPDGFDVTPDMAAWARENAPGAGPRDHEEFCDYWRAQAGSKGVKADWVATWRNWMRRASDKRPTTTGSSRPARGSHTDKALRIMEMAAAMDLGSAREIGA